MSLLPRKDIEPLLRTAGGPCVSIFLPTFRAGGEKQQNPIRLKNVVRGIAERLEEDWGMRSPDADKLLDPVKQLVDDNSFWLHQSDGLALFLSSDTFKSFRLPVQLNELAVVEKRFHLKRSFPCSPATATAISTSSPSAARTSACSAARGSGSTRSTSSPGASRPASPRRLGI